MPALLPLLLALASAPVAAFQTESPRARGDWIDDEAAMLSESDLTQLNARIARIAEARGVELVVAVAPKIEGDPNLAAATLRTTWGLDTIAHSRAMVLTLDTGAHRVGLSAGQAVEDAFAAGWTDALDRELRELGDAGSPSTQLATVIADLDDHLSPRAPAAAPPPPRTPPAPAKAAASQPSPPMASSCMFFSVRTVLGLLFLFGAGRTAYGRSRIGRG